MHYAAYTCTAMCIMSGAHSLLNEPCEKIGLRGGGGGGGGSHTNRAVQPQKMTRGMKF